MSPYLPPKRMGESWSGYLKFHFLCDLPCYFIDVNELQVQISMVVISVPLLLHFSFFFFFPNPKFDFKNGDLDKILSAQQQLSF